MKTLITSSFIGASLLLGAGQASAQDVMTAALFGGDRPALEHNCAEAEAPHPPGDPAIVTQCGVGNR